MSLFNLIDSFANGTLVDDMIDGLEKGVDQFEQLVGAGDEKLNSVANIADGALQNVIDGAEKAAAVSDVVAKKLE